MAPVLKDPSLLIGKNYINGEWTESASGKRFDVFDPSSGAVIDSCPESVEEDVQKAINAAAAAFPAWRSRTGRDRSRILRRWFDLVLENQQDLATLISWENGKAWPDATGEVNFAASFLEWFAEEAPRVYGDIIPHTNGSFRVSVVKEPVGVCSFITPWNFPGAMITRKLGPALAVGCTVVIKTPGETPFTANALIALGEKAGIPKGVVNVITALENTPQLGQVLCASPTVKKISFTGSTRVGRILMNQSSDTLKKLGLELGGNAPFIVFDDADLDVAVSSFVTAKFKVTGQTCVCANRVYVHDSIYDEFIKRLLEAVKGFKVGKGYDQGVTHGPLITPIAADRVAGLVDDAVSKSAQILVGGSKIPSLGPNFFQPTILANVTDQMRVFKEEIFGPVAPIFRFSNEKEVIDSANTTEYGLASYIFTQDLVRSSRVADLLHFSMVARNTGVISDASSPFGGIKYSGIGREGSKYGIDDYTQLKTIVIGGINVTH